MKINKVFVGLLCGAALPSCTFKYANNYKATKFYRSSKSNECSMRFSTFNGKYSFRVHRTSPGEGPITYTVSLESGSMNVYYDYLDEKNLLVSITKNESISDSVGYIEEGQTVYIIIETNEKCSNGSLNFFLN